MKSRSAKENSEARVRLYYDERGLDRYYGLVELGEKYGVFERKGNRVVIGGDSVYQSQVYKDPTKYFTPEVLQALEECAAKEFSYGS